MESSRSYYENYEPQKNFFHLFIIGAERLLSPPPICLESTSYLPQFLCNYACLSCEFWYVMRETKWNGSSDEGGNWVAPRLAKKKILLVVEKLEGIFCAMFTFPHYPNRDSTFVALICRHAWKNNVMRNSGGRVKLEQFTLFLLCWYRCDDRGNACNPRDVSKNNDEEFN